MKIPKIVYPVFLLLIVVGIWYFFSNVYGVRAIFLPSPQSTLSALWSMLQQAEFWQDLLSSWYRVFIGFLISFLIAYPISFASLLNSKVRDTIFYFVEFFRYLPVPVFIPITIYTIYYYPVLGAILWLIKIILQQVHLFAAFKNIGERYALWKGVFLFEVYAGLLSIIILINYFIPTKVEWKGRKY